MVGLLTLLIIYSLSRSGSGSGVGELAREEEEELVGLKGVGEVYPEQKEEEKVDYRGPTLDSNDEDEDEQQQPPSKLAKAILAKDGTSFTSYLNHHFPLTSTAPHLWLTLSDGHWATSGTHALHTFVQRLNKERAAASRGDGRETKLVVLCLDETCVRNSEERGMYAYGGFMWNRPEKVSSLTVGSKESY